MNIEQEIRAQIEKNKGLKLAVGEINNHLSILENLLRKDIMEQVDEAYQRGLEDGKKQDIYRCEGCEWDGTPFDVCSKCRNSYENLYKRKELDENSSNMGIYPCICSDSSDCTQRVRRPRV